jgi:amylosucrase
MPDAPDAAHAAAAAALADLPSLRAQTFSARLDRWWDDLMAGLREIYPGAAAEELGLQLVQIMARAHADRSPELARRDEARTLRPDWFQSPNVLGYAAYADRFGGDLAGVGRQIDYLRELGVTYLHLMPLLTPRPGDSDGGYAVASYRTVRKDLGTVEDLATLAGDLHHHGISLVLDLVLNHVAQEHPWAQAAQAGDQKYREYFYTYPDRTEPDAFEQTMPEIFPDTAPGSFTWDQDLQAWVWTTFNAWQWDMNWTNTQVFAEYAEIILYLANLGVDVLRLDAIAFLWKRAGTSCQNQPEVHAITQALRAVAHIACPALTFKAEAIVGPADLLAYFGERSHHGKVSELAYHNSLMVQIWSMLACSEVKLAVAALRRLTDTPASTAWVTYLRCHDDIGWAIDDGDADSVGLSGGGHRDFLSTWYSGQFPGSSAQGVVFQHNPATGDRRISGSAASLAGVSWAVKTGDTLGLDLAIARLLLAHAIVLGWGGVPVLWMGDELALPNDPHWDDDPDHARDNRWLHRPKMPWQIVELRAKKHSVPGQVFGAIKHMAAVRGTIQQLHAHGKSTILDPSDPGILPVLREHPTGPLLGLYNVTASARPWPRHRLAEVGLTNPVDALTGQAVVMAPDGNVWLPPYAALWLADPAS